jgi:L-alanine-DL-glutamate epimerase-like enolase superfamily enzyme
MRRTVRNDRLTGIAAMAISAVDIALWDLAARLRGKPLCTLLGAVHDAVPVDGSGGFCSYDDHQLAAQLGTWAGQGIPRDRPG